MQSKQQKLRKFFSKIEKISNPTRLLDPEDQEVKLKFIFCSFSLKRNFCGTAVALAVKKHTFIWALFFGVSEIAINFGRTVTKGICFSE